MKRLYNRSYFFDHGIHFECQRCWICCTGDPGIIYIEREEFARIAEYLTVQVPFFIEKYLYPIKSGYSIKESMQTDDVFFMKTGAQSIRFVPTSAKHFPSGLRIYVLIKNGIVYPRNVRGLVVARFIPKNRF